MRVKSTSEAPVEKSSSKVIPAAKAEKAEQWVLPEMAVPKGHGGLPGPLLTAAQLEQIQKQAYEEGFEQGKKEGFAYGHKEALTEGREQIKQWAVQLEGLFKTLDTPLKQLDEQVEHELVQLAIAIVRQLVRREIKADPAQILGVVREALGILPVSARNVRLVLHPDDAELVREVYAVSETELGWKIVEDPVLARGGCRVLADASQVDATLESRLTALVTTLLGGGERDTDAADGTQTP
jgi:flagellar assembly protein FliH